MGSRERDREREPLTTNHQVSSMVVRAEDSGGGGGGGGSDYEPGEVRRDNNRDHSPYYSRSGRFSDNHGYGMRAGSVSPLRQRKMDHHYVPNFDRPSGSSRGRGFRGGRGFGRFRDFSPPHVRGRGLGRPYGRGFDGPGFEPPPFRGEGPSRNNPNVPPREGDWICSEPSCGNLNFARREYCNNCNRFRCGPGGAGPGRSPRRNYLSPPSPRRPPPRIPGPLMNHGPRRVPNGYGSPPPRHWGEDDPRDFETGPPPPRHGRRFLDPPIRKEKPSFHEEDDYRGRGKFDRPISPDWGHRDHGRDEFFHDKRGYNGRMQHRPPSPLRRPLSPLPPPSPPHRGWWLSDGRERSRSPVRGGPKGYGRDSYIGRGRGNHRGIGRGRINDAY